MASPFDCLADVIIGTFGETVTLTDNRGVIRDVSGHFQFRPVEDLDTIINVPVLTLKTVETEFVTEGAGVLIRGERWKVRNTESDGLADGLTRLQLERT